MASLLEGTGGHASHAPLSYEQTAMMGKHLQDQIDALSGRFDSVKGDITGNKDLCTELSNKLAKQMGRLHKLEGDVVDTKGQLDGNRKDLGNTNGVVSKLQQEFTNSNDIIFALRKGHKVVRMDLQKLNQDLTENCTITSALKEALEKKVLGELHRLDGELKQADLNVGRLQREDELLRASIQTVKEDIKVAEGTLMATREDVVKFSKDLCAMDSRMCDMIKTIKDTRVSLEECRNEGHRTREDHETTKSQVADVQLTTMKLGTHARQLQDGFNRTSTGLQATQSQLTNLASAVEGTRENLDSTKNELSNVKSSHDDFLSKLKSVSRTTEETSRVAQETRKCLKETNSLVLPNLQMHSLSHSLKSTTASSTDPVSPREPLSPLVTPKRRTPSRKFDL